MSLVRVACFGMSIDGFSAGPSQSLQHPLGVGGDAVFGWFFHTQTFKKMHGNEPGDTDLDDAFAQRGFDNIGAFVLGRNMFGPIRGPWPDDAWKGWWGDNPPYHTPVFVLTHHPRPPLTMSGGTTFHFITDGIHAALDRARQAAGTKDIRIGGGVQTIRQYLTAGLVDQIHLAIAPRAMGTGEHLLHGIDLPKLGFQCTEHQASAHALHVVLTKQQ